MTKEEAIKRLKSDIYEYSDFTENPNENEFWTAFDMAIEALERMEPPDCESVTHEERMEDEEVITLHKGALKAVTGRFVVYDRKWLKEHFNTTEAMIYGAETCEDCISRERVLLEINRIGFDAFTSYDYYSNLYDFIDGLSSEEPKRKPGKWIRGEAYPHRIYCSECYKTFIPNDEMRAWVDGDLPRKYCPNCGAEMEVEEE